MTTCRSDMEMYNMPDLSRGYCVIDTETSGLSPTNDRIIEVALLIITPEERVLRTGLINSVSKLPAAVSRITGITTRMLQEEGKSPDYIFTRLFEEMTTRNLPVVGHNIIKFDRPFLINEVERVFADESLDVVEALACLAEDRMIDTGALVKGIKIGEVPKKNETHFAWCNRIMGMRKKGIEWSLSVVTQEMGIDWKGTQHRAKGDVVATAQVFETILKRIQAESKE